jgi:hypothetical protein
MLSGSHFPTDRHTSADRLSFYLEMPPGPDGHPRADSGFFFKKNQAIISTNLCFVKTARNNDIKPFSLSFF